MKKNKHTYTHNQNENGSIYKSDPAWSFMVASEEAGQVEECHQKGSDE